MIKAEVSRTRTFRNLLAPFHADASNFVEAVQGELGQKPWNVAPYEQSTSLPLRVLAGTFHLPRPELAIWDLSVVWIRIDPSIRRWV
jgi:hypothetical protein